MRLAVSCLAFAIVSAAGSAHACGVISSPFGDTYSGQPRPAFVFASGGLATRTANEIDARTTTPFFIAGVGGEVHAWRGLHFAPMLDVIARSRANVVSSTDLALASRVSSDGFSNGGFGAAIDLGVWTRVHGGRAIGTLASLTLGAPAGLQASFVVQEGASEMRALAAVIGFDLARVPTS